jgi:hypothetical protein
MLTRPHTSRTHLENLRDEGVPTAHDNPAASRPGGRVQDSDLWFGDAPGELEAARSSSAV